MVCEGKYIFTLGQWQCEWLAAEEATWVFSVELNVVQSILMSKFPSATRDY